MTDILDKTGSDKVEALSHNVSLLLCASVPSFMINLDSNIVAVSLRSISHSLGADFTAIEWVISAYTLTFASLVLPAGSLADRYGRKHMLIAGLAIFSRPRSSAQRLRTFSYLMSRARFRAWVRPSN